MSRTTRRKKTSPRLWRNLNQIQRRKKLGDRAIARLMEMSERDYIELRRTYRIPSAVAVALLANRLDIRYEAIVASGLD
jgi:hypothetical protein